VTKYIETIEGGCEADLKKEFLLFTGNNKTQIALIAVLYRLGMGPLIFTPVKRWFYLSSTFTQ